MRCLVVLPEGGRGGDAPSNLTDGLSQRGMSVALARGPAVAMSKLAQSPYAVVVIIEPARLPDVEDLLHAVSTYYPTVVCWGYERRGADDPGRLAVINGTGDYGNGYQAPAQPPRSTGPGIHTLLHHVPRPLSAPSPLITQEELAMLLGDWPEEDDAGYEETLPRR